METRDIPLIFMGLVLSVFVFMGTVTYRAHQDGHLDELFFVITGHRLPGNPLLEVEGNFRQRFEAKAQEICEAQKKFEASKPGQARKQARQKLDALKREHEELVKLYTSNVPSAAPPLPNISTCS